MAISQNIKKKIAKEIIYFFSAVVLLLLIWVAAEIRNDSLKNNIASLNKKYALLESEIDSIEKTYPKQAKSFKELMQKMNTEEGVKVFPVDDWGDDPVVGSSNITSLYFYLVENNFESLGQNKVLTPKKEFIIIYDDTFERKIINDLKTEKKEYSKKIYSFLKSNNQFFSVDTNSFFACLQGLPEPPSHEVLLKVTDLKREKDETYAKYKENSDKRINVEKLTQGMTSVFFTLLYPVRFIFLLIIWAVKTVKQKE